VRLMVLKQRSGWGYETLVREVSDSLHLRRFCLIPLHERVPDESTVRKLTRRLGPETVAELTRALFEKAVRERRFRARAVRIDSTVVEADVRYPTDSGLALDGARVLAREARKLAAKVGRDAGWVRDRSRAVGRRVRAMTRTLARRSGERKAEVLKLTGQAGKLVVRSVREAKRLVVVARRRARGGEARERSCARSSGWSGSSLVQSGSWSRSECGCAASGSPTGWCRSSIRTPDRSARASSASRTSSVRDADLRGDREHQAGGAGIDPPGPKPGRQPAGEHAAASDRRGDRAPWVAPAGGRARRRLPARTHPANLNPLAPKRTFIAGRQRPGSKRTQRRLGRYRTGVEGRISHLKRGHGLRRTRLKDHHGMDTWTGWAILTYNLDTLAVRGA